MCFTCFFTTYHDPPPLSHFLLKVMAARTYLKQSFISWLLVFKKRREGGSGKVRTPNFVASCTPMWLQVWHSCPGTCPCWGALCLQYSDQLNQELEASSTYKDFNWTKVKAEDMMLLQHLCECKTSRLGTVPSGKVEKWGGCRNRCSIGRLNVCSLSIKELNKKSSKWEPGRSRVGADLQRWGFFQVWFSFQQLQIHVSSLKKSKSLS